MKTPTVVPIRVGHKQGMRTHSYHLSFLWTTFFLEGLRENHDLPEEFGLLRCICARGTNIARQASESFGRFLTLLWTRLVQDIGETEA